MTDDVATAGPRQLATAASLLLAMTWDSPYPEYDPRCVIDNDDSREYLHVQFVGTSKTREHEQTVDCEVWIDEVGEPHEFTAGLDDHPLALVWGPITTDDGRELRAGLMRID